MSVGICVVCAALGRRPSDAVNAASTAGAAAPVMLQPPVTQAELNALSALRIKLIADDEQRIDDEMLACLTD